ncbi:MAG: hypothetical protein JNK76_00660 [Planctomycetales bacterium]|nr:hypothetical protein [Planctomycetales bacterium]MBN8624276.1 hypothetical protein [Planctomycetota bacterium]
MIRLREGPILLCTFTDQRRDWDNIQLITSKNHYAFNLAWLKVLPVPTTK